MIIPPHAELHYRTRLICTSESDDLSSMAGAVRQAALRWVRQRFPDAGAPLEEGRFHEGGTRLISIQPSGLVRTVTSDPYFTGDTPTSEPALWALQARLPDRRVRSRQWAHEMAVVGTERGALRVSVRVHHWLEVGEVGWSPPRPQAGPPSYLLEAARTIGGAVTDGHDALPLSPVSLEPGEGRHLVEVLEEPDRRTPVVYISATRSAGRPAIDPDQVARAVALEAVVYVATAPDLDDELDHFLSKDLRCYGGALRIYRPGLNPRARGTHEAERHRYITRSRLTSAPPSELVAEIAEEVAKAVVAEDPETEPVTFGEIEALERRRELTGLRAEATGLRERSRGGLSAEDARKLFRLNERLEERLRALEEDNARLARRAFHATEQLHEAEAVPGAAEDPAVGAPGEVDVTALVSVLQELPRTPADALELATLLFPHRLRVTEKAHKVAADASSDDPGAAWRVLVAMAGELHRLHFDEDAGDRSALEIREAFRERTGFDVAFTESKSTKASDRLRSLRTIEYEGEEVGLLWHVKWGTRPPRLIRAYYHPDPRRKLLVVGWFGDHLETAGTRRM
ncbi:MAG: hypothetical protein PVI57_15355 [Gemmatimonadota bacterium]|jgi:hypothetical protein